MQVESTNMSIDSQSTYIFTNNTSVIKNLSINGDNYYTLISTNLSNSIFIEKNKEIEDYSELNKDENTCAKDYSKLQISNSQFDFEGCGPYNISISQNDVEIYHSIYQITEIIKNNSVLDYTSILSLSSLENTSMVIMDYIDKNIKIIEDCSISEDKEILNKSIENMIKCEPTGEKFHVK